MCPQSLRLGDKWGKARKYMFSEESDARIRESNSKQDGKRGENQEEEKVMRKAK